MRVPESGDLVRTYLPKSVSYIGTSNIVEHCTIASNSSPIAGCTYDSAKHMIEFLLPSPIGRNKYNNFELGYMRNPSYSEQKLKGFALQVLDS